MQIFEKYKKVYVESLRRLRKERERFSAELEKILGVRVVPSVANFIMVELVGNSSKELCKKLLIDYNIFVKDLSNKIAGKNYLRFAVRATKDNDKLLDALKKELSS